MVSIITRAYNAEKYIEECAESVVNQSFDDFEWIVLENASTDRTREILEEYARKDQRIHLFINQKNYTGSSSTESGIYGTDDLRKIARGKYLTNLDSDDYFDRDFLKIMCEATNGKDVDIIAAGFSQFIDGNAEAGKREVVPKEFTGSDIAEMGKSFSDFYEAFGPVWGKLILREFYLKHLEYVADRPAYVTNGGDTYTCLRLLQQAGSCICIEKPLYFYRIRNTSISKTNYFKERYRVHDAIFYESLRLLKGWGKNTEKNFYCLCLIHLSGLRKVLSMIPMVETLTLKEKLDAIKEVLEDEVYRDYIDIFSDENKKEWEGAIDIALEHIYENCTQKEEMIPFYRYNFSRRYLAKKKISKNEANDYEIILYIVAAISRKNEFAYNGELLQLCVEHISGKKCNSLEEVKRVIEQYTNTGQLEYEKKKQISDFMAVGEYAKAKEILVSFGNNMMLDCDVLFGKACCCYADGDVKNTLVLLSVANELYPDEAIIEEDLRNILDHY